MDLDFTTHGCKRHFVVIEGANEISISRHSGGGIGLSEKIKCDFGLGKEAIPKGAWEGWDHAG